VGRVQRSNTCNNAGTGGGCRGVIVNRICGHIRDIRRGLLFDRIFSRGLFADF
jgi:hypothetical protein